jgi:hypothetical protein
MVYAGAVSNFTPGAIEWLRQALQGVPPEIRASIHRYPDADQDPNRPKKGFPTLQAEMAAFKAAIGGRRWACTEFGFHTAPYKTGWWIFSTTHRRTDTEVMTFLKQWFARFKAAGAEFGIVYQLHDGIPDTWMNRYGMRGTDGRWKAQVLAAR